MYSLEADIHKNDGSILFADEIQLKTTNGKTTTVVAPGFSFITGFKQINSSHILVVDSSIHCVKMVNREDNSNTVFAGLCNAKGFVDGATAKFYFPYSIETDERNPGHLLITDLSNHALRSVDVTSGTVSTVIRTGFNFPRGLTWYSGRLLVCNRHFISEISWSSTGSATNNRLTTFTVDRKFRDGDFSVAQFSYPQEIKQIGVDLVLVADNDNNKLRLLNMSTRKVLPVCVGFSSSCTNGTRLTLSPLSLLIGDEQIYVGGFREIRKLTGKCANTFILETFGNLILLLKEQICAFIYNCI